MAWFFFNDNLILFDFVIKIEVDVSNGMDVKTEKD